MLWISPTVSRYQRSTASKILARLARLAPGVLAQSRVGLPAEHLFRHRVPALALPVREVVAGQRQHRPVEFHALVRMLVLRQVVVVALGLDPHRVGLERRLRQLEGPGGDLALAVGGRGAADRHHGLHEVRVHQAPVVRLRRPHRHAGGEHHLADLQVITQQPVVQVHDVVVAVDRELAPEPVGRFGRAEQPERIDEHDIEAIGVEQQPGPDQRTAGEAVAGLSRSPVAEHRRRIARVVGVDDDRVDDLALGVAPRRAHGDVGRARRLGAERLERGAAHPAVRPRSRLREVVLAADAEVGHLVGELLAVQRCHHRAGCQRLLRQRRCRWRAARRGRWRRRAP